MKNLFTLLLLATLPLFAAAQGKIGVGTTTPEALLDLTSADEGLLLPRIALSGTDVTSPLVNPTEGELIYNTATAGLGVTAVSPGFYFWNGASWSRLKAGTVDGASLSLSGSDLSISGGNTVSLAGLDTDDQMLAVSGSSLTISEGNTVNLSALDTDDQTLSVSGTSLTISEGNTVDLTGLRDADWYLENTTGVSSSIDDNIYTNGSVGIGTTSPAERLSVYPGTNVSAELGQAHLGFVGHSAWAGFSHVDANNTTNYALLHNGSGQTLLNAASGQSIFFRNNNANIGVFNSNGNFGVGTTTPSSKVEVVGDVALNGVNSDIIYESKETHNEWRLVYVDDFEGGTEGWIANGSLSTGNAGLTRESNNIAGLVGFYVRPNNNDYTVKKNFNTSGMSYSEVKVEFTYLFLDSWDTEIGWLAVKSAESSNPTLIWNRQHNHDWADMELNGAGYNVSFYGNGSWSDLKYSAEAKFNWSGGGFWLEFGANLDGATDDETFAVDNIRIYVR